MTNLAYIQGQILWIYILILKNVPNIDHYGRILKAVTVQREIWHLQTEYSLNNWVAGPNLVDIGH